MASRFPRRQITKRDLDIFTALYRCPLTAGQLLTLSATWRQPFTSLRRVQDRLHSLTDAGLIRSWPYAMTSPGSSPRYYKLTLSAYRTLCGDAAQPPTKRFFDEVAVARHRHTYHLSQFIVKTCVAAHQHGVQIAEFHPENTFTMSIGEETLRTDGTFTAITAQGVEFPVHLEIDNSTETVRTAKQVESIERKLRLHVQHERTTRARGRVLFVTTVSRERLDTIFEAVRSLSAQIPYQLFYGVYLPDYLATDDPFRDACFRTARDPRTPLIRPRIALPEIEARTIPNLPAITVV